MIRAKRKNSIISFALALLTAASAVTSLSVLTRPTRSEPEPLPQVIWNYPSNVDPDNPDLFLKVPLNQLNWNKKEYHSGYDGSKGAYTDKTSKQYNGVATKDHVALSDNAIRFLGYGINNNLDLLYTTTYDAFEALNFTLDPVQLKFHTLNQTGVLFNGFFDAGNNYTGYALVVDSNGEVKKNENGVAALKLVYMKSQFFKKANANSITDNNYPYPGGFAFAWEDVIMDTIVEGVSTAFDVTLCRGMTGFSLYIDGNLVREIEPAENMSQGGFGFFAGYYKHNCNVLTVMEYSNLSITVKLPLAQAGCEVRFIDKDTGRPVADAQTVPRNLAPGGRSYAGDEYLVDWEPVQTIIGTDGGIYQYVFSDRDEMARITYHATPADNITTLYYKYEPLLPEKHASTDGGATWEDGSEESPVPVVQGDVIDYRIDIKTPAQRPKDIVFRGAAPMTETAAEIVYPLSALTASNQFFCPQSGNNVRTNLGNSPGNLSVASAGSAEPYLISYWAWQTFGNNQGWAQYLWLEAPGLRMGDYSVSVRASVEFRGTESFTDLKTSYSNANPMSNFTSSFKGILTGTQKADYGAYDFQGAHSGFTDTFMTHSVASMPLNNVGHTWQMGADGIGAVSWQTLNVNNATSYPPPVSAQRFADELAIGDGERGVVGLCFSGGHGNTTHSGNDALLHIIRVYEVRFQGSTAAHSLTDLLPEGIALADDLPNHWATSLETDFPQYAPTVTMAKETDEDTGRQRLIWGLPVLPCGASVSVRFKARVVETPGLYENAAQVTNLLSPFSHIPDETNSTWHECNMVKVTEQYRNYLNQTQDLKDDTYTWVVYGEGYGVAPYLRDPISKGTKTYRYYAYSVDGGTTIIYSAPPDGLPCEAEEDEAAGHLGDYLWNEVRHNNNAVILYFIEDVAVTIHFVDRTSGIEIRTVADYGARGGVPYILPPSCLASFSHGGAEYNYINIYERNSDGEEGGSPALPAFSALEMVQNNEITLYFANDPRITIRFVIMEGDIVTSRILKNPLTEIVPYFEDYDPGASAHQPLDTVLTDPATGKAYKFAGYRLNSGAIVYTADINDLERLEAVDRNHTYTLLYVEKPSIYTLHLRQVVLGHDGGTALPYTGYFNLTNSGTTFSVTTDSNMDGLHVDFRDIIVTFSDEAEMIYFINAIVPQYYVYDGFVFSEADTQHDPADRSGSPAGVDFAHCTDLWVTVYIKPLPDPGKHNWDMKPNDFGVINPTP